jgi:hypothetical protein
MVQRLSYLSGRLSLGAYTGTTSAPTDLRFLGNCPEITIQPQENVAEHFSSQVPERPKDEIVQNQSMMTLTVTLEDTNKNNVALAMRGSITSSNSGTASAEAITAPAAGNYFQLSKPFFTAITSITSDPAGTTFDVGDDYVVEAPGLIYVPSGSTLAGTDILVSYTYPAMDAIKAFNADVEYYYLSYVGLNAAFNNAPVAAKMFKVRFKPTQQLQLVSQDFEKYQLQGEILYDAVNSADGGFYVQYQTQDPA